MQRYEVHCDCGAVSLQMTGAPKVKAHCHCSDCRDLLQVPFHSVTAWSPETVEILKGLDQIVEYQHPTKKMKRIFCKNCGEVLYNTNAMGWKIISQLLISKCYSGKLPEELRSTQHFFYDSRVADINDDLPK